MADSSPQIPPSDPPPKVPLRLTDLPGPLLARVLDLLDPASLTSLGLTCRSLYNATQDALDSGLEHNSTFLRVDVIFPTSSAERRIAYVLTPRRAPRTRERDRPRLALDVDFARTRALLEQNLMRLAYIVAGMQTEDAKRAAERELAVARAERDSLLFQGPSGWDSGLSRAEVTWSWRGNMLPTLAFTVEFARNDRTFSFGTSSTIDKRRPSMSRPASPAVMPVSSPTPSSSGGYEPRGGGIKTTLSMPDLSTMKLSSSPSLVSDTLAEISVAHPVPSHASTAPLPEKTASWESGASNTKVSISVTALDPVLEHSTASPLSRPTFTGTSPTPPPRSPSLSPSSSPAPSRHAKRSSWSLPFSSSRRAQEREREQERLDRLNVLAEAQKALPAGPFLDWDGDGIPDNGPIRMPPSIDNGNSDDLSSSPNPISGFFGKIFGRHKEPIPAANVVAEKRAPSPTPPPTLTLERENSVRSERGRERDKDESESVVKTAVVVLSQAPSNNTGSRTLPIDPLTGTWTGSLAPSSQGSPSFLKITYEVAQGSWFGGDDRMAVQGVSGNVALGWWLGLWK